MTRGAFVVALLLFAGCALDDSDSGYRPTSAEARELLAMCEQHATTPSSPTTIAANSPEMCRLGVVLTDAFGSGCSDFAALKATWEKYLTTGDVAYTACEGTA